MGSSLPSFFSPPLSFPFLSPSVEDEWPLSILQGSADEGKADGEQRGTPVLLLRASPLIQKDGHVHDGASPR